MFRLLVTILCCFSLSAGLPDNWNQPFPAHRIVGNLYYVGSADLACFLIATPSGHILVNSGIAGSTPLIRKSIEDLGFKFSDVKILLTNQAHFDHVAAMAEIKRLTGAKFAATSGDAPVLEDGGKSDYHFGSDLWFAPVHVERILQDGEVIELGGTNVTVHVTAGHTKGSATYTLQVPEGGRTYHVVIANFGSVNPGVKLVNNPKYPHIAEDYRHTFDVQKKLPCDIFVAAHASMYGLADKYKPQHDASAFVDPAGYQSAIAYWQGEFEKRLKQQQPAK